MLGEIVILVLDRHLAKAIADLEDILAHQAYFSREEVIRFLHLEVLLMNCLKAFVELSEAEDVRKEDIVDI